MTNRERAMNILHDKPVDRMPAVHFGYWEDICFKNGPLLSPAKFEELCAKHYKKRNDLCHQYGIDVISLDCDGVVGQLLPTWFENGVNTMFPIEVGVWGLSLRKAVSDSVRKDAFARRKL